MQRSLFISLLVSSLFLCAPTVFSADSTKPNVVFIFVDDMGYGDATCYNADAYVQTPGIDSLAEGGVRFTSGYVTAPICYPSRVGMITGAYQARFGCYSNMPPVAVPEEQLVMPEAMDAAGYSTAVIGKWNEVKTEAPSRYVDETAVIMDWASDYWRPLERGVDKDALPVWGPPEGTNYETDLMTDAAVNFIENHKDSPFFIYLSYNAPHTPLRALEKFRDDVAHIPTEPERVYAAMLLSIDEGVQRVMGKLEEHGLTENTLVVFVSDNGPTVGRTKYRGYRDDWPEIKLGSTGPLQGGKFQLVEGGIRVPFIMQFPARLPAGVVENRMVSSLDLYPTFTALAGFTPPEGTILDGENLMPFLEGEQEGPVHERLFWSDGSNGGLSYGAVRQGDWKLHLNHRQELEVTALYNLAEDIDESDNVADQNPAIVEELKARYVRWLEEMPPHQGAETDIDNSDTDHVSTTGDWQLASEAKWEEGKNYLVDGNSGKGEKSVRFDLPIEKSGYYEIQTNWPRQWPDGTVLSQNTPVTITHYGGTTTVHVDQTLGYTHRTNDAWVTLGKYYFEEGQGSVIFSNEGTEGMVVVDALRLYNWSIQEKASPRRWRRIELGMPFPGPEAMAQDYDADGLNNMEEFAWGLDPLKADAGKAADKALKITPTGETVELRFEGLGDRTGLTYELSKSHDLQHWEPLASWVSGTDITRSPEEIVFPDTEADDSPVYYRLQLQQAD